LKSKSKTMLFSLFRIKSISCKFYWNNSLTSE
jgi:hypothetical protein